MIYANKITIFYVFDESEDLRSYYNLLNDRSRRYL